MGRLDGRVALITGGARGMGKSHVRRFVDEGATVVIGDVLDDEGSKLAADTDNARFVHLDVTDPSDWENAVRSTLDAHGALHVLVNNAGIMRHQTIEKMTLDECRRIIEVNLIGQWLGIKAVIPAMRDSGGGSIVNVSSTEGFNGAAGMSAYSASKFGIRGLTKSAARELGQYGIRVNSIHPGGIVTAMSMQPDIVEATADRAQAIVDGIPLKRLGSSSEVSGLVAFLASDDSSYCTGSEVLVDGGFTTGFS
jgi:3alpha(or 20beta)-hydroxysteroid dehydrogenase